MLEMLWLGSSMAAIVMSCLSLYMRKKYPRKSGWELL